MFCVEANKTIQTVHHKAGSVSLMPASASADMLALEKEVNDLRERVADLQSDKVLIEEELKEAVSSRDQAQGDRTKVSPPLLSYTTKLCQRATGAL